jgi:hypothetical protein
MKDVHFFLGEACYLWLLPIASRQAISIHSVTRVHHTKTPKQKKTLPHMAQKTPPIYYHHTPPSAVNLSAAQKFRFSDNA